MKRYFLLLILFFTLTLQAQEELAELIANYKAEAELSKVTRKESAGILEVFTRDDLEKMQAHTLTDVLNAIPGIYLSRGANNLTMFSTPSTATLPLTTTRLYINDHDMTSSSFGSAFIIWGEMPIEYIDHIEVYKATSSIEFGNENASFIVKLYTKTAARDTGSKITLLGDDLGSYEANIYTTKTLSSDLSYFFYINKDSIKRTVYHNLYEGVNYDYKSNKRGSNIYGSLSYKKSLLEVGIYRKKNDSFIGIGTNKTPSGGDLKAKHNYIHLTHKAPYNIKLQLSYDDLDYTRTYLDRNGIRIANADPIDRYDLTFEDEILSTIIEKKIETDKHTLLLGGFYKHKKFTAYGDYQYFNQEGGFITAIGNSVNMTSLYIEENYYPLDSLHLVVSFKRDAFHYEKDVKSDVENIFKAGLITQQGKWKTKFLFNKTYVPLAFYQIYNPDNTPYKANPQLSTPQMKNLVASLEYKTTKYRFEVGIAHAHTKNGVYYNPTSTNGWKNATETLNQTVFKTNYSYFFDLDNRILFDLTHGSNSKTTASPSTEFRIRSFNRYKMLDFYTALTYRNSYTAYDTLIDESYDLTAAIKYHYSPDLSFGLKGDNILNKGYAQRYRGVDEAIPVIDQKFWISMEYLF